MLNFEHAPLLDQLDVKFNLCTKFEVLSFIQFKFRERVPKYKWSRDLNTPPFGCIL